MARSMPQPLRVSIAVLLAFAASPVAIAQPPPPPSSPSAARRPFAKPGAKRQTERIRAYDVLHIKAELTLDIENSIVRGTVTHSIKLFEPDRKSITMDCGADLKVTRVAVAGKEAGFTRDKDELTIALERPQTSDDNVEIAIAYSGAPKKGMQFVKPSGEHRNRKVCVWTVGEPEDARYWLPCYDYPNERSTAEMIITVAKPLSVVSNGVLASTNDNGDGTSTYRWKMDQRLPAYLISVVAAEFNVYRDKLGDLPIEYYALKEVDEATARGAMGKTPKMIDFFNKTIGVNYAYGKYAQTCLPEFGGGMEHTSATTMTDTILVDAIGRLESSADGIVAHELAHQWFGDLLTCRNWANLWLNEGFASYFDALFTEHDLGENAFRIAMASNLSGYLGSDAGYRRPIVEERYDTPWQMFDGVTYAKGACVLHALRGLLGDDAWRKGIRQYVSEHRDQNVVTEDFRKSMELASGKDLGWFFDQWVYRGGHPELKARWRYEPDDLSVRLTIEQTQAIDETTPLFRLPTTALIVDDSGERSVPIVIDGKVHEFVISAAKRPRTVRIDPKGWIPKKLTFDKPAEEWIDQLERSSDFWGRLEAADALAETSKTEPASAAVARALERERDPHARVELARRAEKFAALAEKAMLKAAGDSDPRVRVIAARALASLPPNAEIEKALRVLWSNPSEPRGARTAALRGLVSAKVKDADDLVAAALKERSSDNQIARAALQVVLDAQGDKAREAAVTYSRSDNPEALRAASVQALARMAKDDPQAEGLLLQLMNDPSERVRISAIMAVLNSGSAAALARVRSAIDAVPGPIREMLRRRLDDMKKPEDAGASAQAVDKRASDLEAKAAELELEAKELRNQAEAVRLKAQRAKLNGPKARSGQ